MSKRLLLSLAVLVACSEGALPNADVSVTWDTLESGVVHASYSAIPATPRWDLEADLRLGSVDGEGPAVFGAIRGIEVDADGQILVLDYMASEIFAFGPDGEFLELVATKGDGPREVNTANGLRIDDDGGLWISDHGKWRFTRLRRDGEVETYPFFVGGFGYLWQGGVTLDGQVWSFWPHSGRSPSPLGETGVLRGVSRAYYVSFDPSNGQLDSVHIGAAPFHSIRRPRGMSGVPFSPSLVHVFDPSGYVWTALSSEYRLTRQTVTGDTVLIVDIRAELQPVTSDDRREAIARFEEFSQRAGHVDVDWDDVMPQTKPILRQLIVDDEGRLWVDRVVGEEDVFDVFAADGRFLGTVDPAFPFAAHFPIVIRHGSLYALQTDSLDVPFVVRARLPELN